jgi:cytochrome-b5 reductase
VGFFELLVKTYPMGCISKHLAEMQVGEFLEVKGPKGTFEYAPNMAAHLGMIAGGTGITPMYQVIRHVLEDPKDRTRISLIYANVNEDDILLRGELEALVEAHPDRFRIHYTLGNPPKGWAHSQGFVSAAMIKECFASPAEDVRILMCGPPPMVMAMSEHCEALGYGPAKSDPASRVFKF